MTKWSVLEGDCLDVMAGMEPASIDSIVTDPPYGLGFMGRACVLEGRRFVGIEREPEYCAIARARIAASVDGIGLFANLSENSANPATI